MKTKRLFKILLLMLLSSAYAYAAEPVLLQEGSHTISVSENLMFYDNGGPDGKLSPGINAIYTFVPAADGYSININATSFSIGNGRMYIYSGKEVNENALLGTATGFGTANGPKNLTSKALDGAITIKFQATTASTLDGFAIEINLHKKVPFALTGLSSQNYISSENLIRGSRQNPLLKINAIVDGDMDRSKFSNFSLDLSGTSSLNDIEKISLYYGKNITEFNPFNAILMGEIKPTQNVISFPDSISTGDNGSYTFYIIADISGNAAPGNKVSACLKSIQFNDKTFSPSESSSPASASIAAGMKGTFTIGASGADYSSFAAATADLKKNGVEGEVVFEILPGSYSENLIISNIRGGSETHPIIFKSKSADKSSVTIKGVYSSANKTGAIRVLDAPFVTIRDISVEVSSSSFENVCYVAQGSHHVCFINCYIKAPLVTSGYSGPNLVRNYVASSELRNNDFLTVENCNLEGGYIGLYIGGTSIIANPKEKGIVIKNNTITDAGSKGVYVMSDDDVSIIGNTITTSKTGKNDYYGIDLYRIGGNSSVSANYIRNTHSAYSTGIYLRNESRGSIESPISVFNNDIIITNSPNIYGRGIQVSNDSRYINLDFNTIRIAGTGAYGFATSGNNVPVSINFRNNILHDSASSGAAFYFYNQTDISAYNLSHNNIHAPGNIIVKSYAESIDSFKELIGDTTNLFISPSFVSETDSRLKEPGELQKAVYLDYVATDIAGNQRSHVVPTIGAFEYVNLDAVKPEMAADFPKLLEKSSDAIAFSVKWNETGKLYSKIVDCQDSDLAPSISEMLLQTPVNVIANAEATVKFSSLKASNKYKAYFFMVSTLKAESDLNSSDIVSTDRYIAPLTASFSSGSTPKINQGESVSLAAKVSGGDLPYKFEWRNQLNEVISTDSVLIQNPDNSQIYRLTVSSADGQTVSLKKAVHVIGQLVPATFDDNFISENLMPQESDATFYSGSFAFHCTAFPAMSYWTGFALSNDPETAFEKLDHQFRSAPGGGLNSSNFAVAYPSGLNIDVTNSPDGDTISGCYLTNNAYSFSSMTKGDGYSKKFEKGDWFMVTARATKADGTTLAKDFYLADFRDDDPNEHYVLDSWQWLDLSSFGKVVNLTFSFDGSDKGQWGLNTPAYLCLENLGGDKIFKSHNVTLNSGDLFDLSAVFDIENNGARCSYSISRLDSVKTVNLEISDSKLILHSSSHEEADIVAEIAMTQKGKTQFALLSINKPKYDGLEAITDDNIKIIPVSDHLDIFTSLSPYSIEIFSLDGRKIFYQALCNGNTSIHRNAWNSGIYMVKITSGKQIFIKKIVLQ